MKKQLLIVLASMMLVMTTACSGETKTKENPKSKDGKTIVTMSLQGPDSFYMAAEKKFEAKYPDIDLQIQTYKQIGEKQDPNDIENYLKQTNTELLSGKGADIIEVSRLPIGKYVNKNLLVNLSDMMEQDKSLNKSDLQMNILESAKVNGSLYAIPFAFFLNTFVGDGDILEKSGVNVDDTNWTWKQFGELSQQILKQEGAGSNQYALYDYLPEQILIEMVEDSYAELVDRTTQEAKFDSPLFMEMMTQTKKMYDDQIITSKSAETGKQFFNSWVLYYPADFIGPYSTFANPKLLKKPHGQGQTGEVTFSSPFQLAIQAKSAVKEEAWQFISFLLSEEAQTMQELYGFSILKSVNEKNLDEAQKQVNSGTMKREDGTAIKVPDEAFDHFKALINEANRFASLDRTVFSIIDEESKSFFSGQKSVDEVANLIQSRVTTYLNE